MLFQVRIRRDIGQRIKENALQLDGHIYNFERGWEIDDDRRYPGESAWLPRDNNYPIDAPFWIASGDLTEYLKDK